MAVKIELLLSVHCIQNTILHSDYSFVVQLTVHINKQVFRGIHYMGRAVGQWCLPTVG